MSRPRGLCPLLGLNYPLIVASLHCSLEGLQDMADKRLQVNGLS